MAGCQKTFSSQAVFPHPVDREARGAAPLSAPKYICWVNKDEHMLGKIRSFLLE